MGAEISLSKADLEARLCIIPKVTPISSNDQGLFQRFFLTELGEERYPNSWAYMTQACRGLGELGYKYYDGERLVSFGSHKGHYVIVNPLGQDVGAAVSNLCRDLKEYSNKPVFIKHLKELLQRDLCENFVGMEKYPWAGTERYDDATYPEVIISCDSLLELVTRKDGEEVRPSDRKIRQGIRRFTESLLASPQALASTYFLNNFYRDVHGHLIYQKEVMDLLEAWAQSDKLKIAPYLNMVNRPPESGFSFVSLLQGEAVGFYVFDRIGVQTAGGYAMITDHKKLNGATEACYFLAASTLKKFGIEKINLGGSETESLHFFKQKIGKTNFRNGQKEHLVYL